jgi:hypothetical protein
MQKRERSTIQPAEEAFAWEGLSGGIVKRCDDMFSSGQKWLPSYRPNPEINSCNRPEQPGTDLESNSQNFGMILN